jgi:hypothetical protein
MASSSSPFSSASVTTGTITNAVDGTSTTQPDTLATWSVSAPITSINDNIKRDSPSLEFFDISSTTTTATVIASSVLSSVASMLIKANSTNERNRNGNVSGRLLGNELPSSIKSIILSQLRLRDNLSLATINKSWWSISQRNESQPFNGAYIITTLYDRYLPRSRFDDDHRIWAGFMPLLIRHRPVTLYLETEDIIIFRLVAMEATLRSLCIHNPPFNRIIWQLLSFLTSLTLLKPITIDEPLAPQVLEPLTQLFHLKCESLQLLTLPPSLQSLECDEPIGISTLESALNQCSHLQSLSVYSPVFDTIPAESIMKILSNASSLTSLSAGLLSDIDPSILSKYRMLSLQHITMVKLMPGVMRSLSIAAPNLTSLAYHIVRRSVAIYLSPDASFASLTTINRQGAVLLKNWMVFC